MSKVFIVYWSGTGNTEKMADLLEIGAKSAGAEVVKKAVSQASPSEIDDYDVIALGCPSMGAEELDEEMESFVSEVMPKLSAKRVALFGSYGWGDGEWMRNWVQKMSSSGINLVSDEGLIVNESPEGAEEERCKEYGKLLA